MLTRRSSSSTPLNSNSTKKILVTMVSDSDPESDLEQENRSRLDGMDIIPETDYSSGADRDDNDNRKNRKTKSKDQDKGKGKGTQFRTASDESDSDNQPSKMKSKATGARTEGNRISNKCTEVDELYSDVPSKLSFLFLEFPFSSLPTTRPSSIPSTTFTE